MNDCCLVDRLTGAQGRAKLNLRCASRGRFVESMAQTAKEAFDSGVTRCSEENFEQDFAFDAQLTSLLCVKRSGF